MRPWVPSWSVQALPARPPDASPHRRSAPHTSHFVYQNLKTAEPWFMENSACRAIRVRGCKRWPPRLGGQEGTRTVLRKGGIKPRLGPPSRTSELLRPWWSEWPVWATVSLSVTLLRVPTPEKSCLRDADMRGTC